MYGSGCSSLTALACLLLPRAKVSTKPCTMRSAVWAAGVVQGVRFLCDSTRYRVLSGHLDMTMPLRQSSLHTRRVSHVSTFSVYNLTLPAEECCRISPLTWGYRVRLLLCLQITRWCDRSSVPFPVRVGSKCHVARDRGPNPKHGM